MATQHTFAYQLLMKDETILFSLCNIMFYYISEDLYQCTFDQSSTILGVLM